MPKCIGLIESMQNSTRSTPFGTMDQAAFDGHKQDR